MEVPKMREFFVAGVQHHKSDQVLDKLTEGTVFELRPEPDNKFDPNAVAIIYNNDHQEDDCMIGYVPAKFSGEIAAAIQIGNPLVCTITYLNPSAKPWERIQVVIKGE